MATRPIIYEPLEAECRDTLGHDCSGRGAERGWNRRHGVRTKRMNSAALPGSLAVAIVGFLHGILEQALRDSFNDRPALWYRIPFFDDHAARQHRVGHGQFRVVMVQPGDGGLTVWTRPFRQADDLVGDLRCAAATAGLGEPDAAPVGLWKRTKRCTGFRRSPARGEQGNSFPVDLGQVGLADQAVSKVPRPAGCRFFRLVRVECVEAAGELAVSPAHPDAFRRPGT